MDNKKAITDEYILAAIECLDSVEVPIECIHIEELTDEEKLELGCLSDKG